MNYLRIKDNFLRSINNVFGWSTNRKIIVFESDDWGSNRMPSPLALKNLEKKGLKLNHSKYATLDTLEKKEDLEALVNILSSFKNKPVFTTNMVMGSPDYEKIRSDNFGQYHHQNLWKSYEYYYGTNLEPLWKNSIAHGFISPQYHAKEHLNTRLWMHDLRIGRDKTRRAFDQNFYGLIDGTSSIHQKNYLMGYFVESMNDLKDLQSGIKTGIQMFQDFFGFTSKTMVACNYVWPLEIESLLKDLGIDTIQGQRGHIIPQPSKHGLTRVKYHYTGEKNKIGQNYTVRNVKFEPFENQNMDWVDSALKEISNSFFLNRPAIISTHRVNYVSNLSEKNRDDSLHKLNTLLGAIVKKWPEAEFLSSANLSKLMNT